MTLTASATSQTTMGRVYLANDEAFLYVRVDNVAGSLPSYAVAPTFVVRVYASDFAKGSGESSKIGADGGSLPRAATFMVERQSDAEEFALSKVVAGAWTKVGVVAGAIAPQWDPRLGRVGVVIPIAAASSGQVGVGAWAHLCVTMAIVTPDGSVHEVHRAAFHYRLSEREDAWIYGNIEE